MIINTNHIFIEPPISYQKLLIYHGLGSGKTRISILVAEIYKK